MNDLKTFRAWLEDMYPTAQPGQQQPGAQKFDPMAALKKKNVQTAISAAAAGALQKGQGKFGAKQAAQKAGAMQLTAGANPDDVFSNLPDDEQQLGMQSRA